MSGAEMLVLEMSDRLEAMRQERDAAIARAEATEAASSALRQQLEQYQFEIDDLNEAGFHAARRAETAEAALAQCQAWRQEDADNLNHCIRAKQKLLDDRSMLRRALARLVGVDTVEELRNMETIMRAAPAPAQDKAAAIDAIHALIEVQP